jgi:ADP-heptose:LPS heptosyltransferase
MPRHQGKILIIRGGAIGDFILTLPAISALRKQFPDARLDILGYPHIAQLALAGGLVDDVKSIEAGALAGFFARNGDLNPNLADYFSEFHLILSYLYDPDGIFQTNVARCAPAQFIAAPHRADDKLKVHASKVYLQPLERLAIFDADPVPRLSLRQDLRVAPSRLAMHPGSGSEKKNWPENKWADLLARILNETNWNLLLVGGEAESERMRRLGAALPLTRAVVIQSRPLTEVAAALRQCAAFVGHDSGISHLASALGLRGLVLWGDTVSEVWRPPSERVRLLRNPSGLSGLRPSQVFAELSELLSSPRHPD